MPSSTLSSLDCTHLASSERSSLIYSLINVTLHIFPAVALIILCPELVSVPRKVDIQSGHEKRVRRRRHQIQEPG